MRQSTILPVLMMLLAGACQVPTPSETAPTARPLDDASSSSSGMEPPAGVAGATGPTGTQGSECPAPARGKVTLYNLARTAHTWGFWCISGRLDRVLQWDGSYELGFVVADGHDLCGSGVGPPPQQLVISGNANDDGTASPACSTAPDYRTVVGRKVIVFARPGEFFTNGEPAGGGFWQGPDHLPVFVANEGWLLDQADGNLVRVGPCRGELMVEEATVGWDLLEAAIAHLAVSTPAEVAKRCEALGCPGREDCLWGEACGHVTYTDEPDECGLCERTGDFNSSAASSSSRAASHDGSRP